VQSIKEDIQNEESMDGQALDFYTSKQTVLGAYFQLVNLMILKRLNGFHSDYTVDLPEEKLVKEFNLNEDRGLWGDQR
jgi:hypothetical protein